MILQGFLTAVLLIYFYAFGILFKKIFPQIPELQSIYLLGGILVVSFLGTISAFVFPLNSYYEFGLIFCALAISIIHSKQLKEFFLLYKNLDKNFYLISFLGLIVSVTFPFILDHFGYYIPTVKWLDFNGYQKGISNFEWVLAQNSSWHILQASLNETLDYAYRLNFALFVVYNLYVFEKKDLKLLIFNPLFLFFINSPSPDLPIFVYSIVLINEYFQKQRFQPFYLLISAFLVLIKPIAIILPLFFLIELIKGKKIKLNKITLGVLGLVIIFLAKNIITSANPIFPFGFGNLTFLEWSSPKIMYEISSQYGRLIPLKESFSFEEVNEMSTITYYKYLFSSFKIRTLILISILIFSGLLFLLSFFKSTLKEYKVLMIIILFKSLIVILTSAQFRFLLDVLTLDLLMILLLIKSQKIKQLIYRIAIFFSIIIVVLFNIKGIFKEQQNNIATLSFVQPFRLENLLKPSNYSKLNFNIERIGNLEFNYTKEYPFIYNGEIPTMSFTSLSSHLYYYKYYPQLINKQNIKKGFKSVRMDKNIQSKIEEILSNKNGE